MEINDPKFDQGDHVWASFHGALAPLVVASRFYDPDRKTWYYKLSETVLLFVERDLSVRELEEFVEG